MKNLLIALLTVALLWLIVRLQQQPTKPIAMPDEYITPEQLREEFERLREEFNQRIIPLEDSVGVLIERVKRD